MVRAHRHIRNKRSNFHHQEARKIVDRHGALGIEGLRITNMVRNPCLAKSIADAGWNQFLTILSRKAEEAGVVVVVVNPAGTSQVCSGCGRTVPKTLSDRWPTCPYEDCGLSLQRDHNSARTILHAARVPACGSPVLGSDPQQNPLPSGMGSVKEVRRNHRGRRLLRTTTPATPRHVPPVQTAP